MTEIHAPARVAVVGGGRMGAGIAQVFATLGSEVVIAETGDQAAARARVATGLSRADERGKLIGSTPDEILERVSTVSAPSELPDEVDLVVEAVPENPGLKIEVLAAIDKTVRADAVIVSNTSSLSITELGAALNDPSRFLGMHFFNPVPVSALVEVVTAPATADAVIDQVVAWVALLGKTEVVINDSPGFATSRLGVCLGLEAIRMLEEGVADAAAIDRAMELGYRHPIGPLRSTDLVGLDVRLAIAEHLAATLGPRFEPPKLLREKVGRGELGRKSGQGFFSWTGPGF
ncbi:3-hydroxyacyl-CoA dehydrogenase family protein [Rhodococcus spongiicola]|uniref:3-hydroxyacyl-CoA dehydrogenase family protein n=1 Tax=Rhodococcus spongiicola TaxID=2487352 RepID=A0A3S3DZG9_9NOCA|nr:3-hydroxyacyl-CoA dehydrogenase family protein [Rhodococcus spongiicola]RVW02449.1 3-hydroxyacyl-CoA dehydrogenase family protein [Rhodococcus spongiicola]